MHTMQTMTSSVQIHRTKKDAVDVEKKIEAVMRSFYERVHRSGSNIKCADPINECPSPETEFVLKQSANTRECDLTCTSKILPSSSIIPWLRDVSMMDVGFMLGVLLLMFVLAGAAVASGSTGLVAGIGMVTIVVMHGPLIWRVWRGYLILKWHKDLWSRISSPELSVHIPESGHWYDDRESLLVVCGVCVVIIILIILTLNGDAVMGWWRSR